jgi:hypothetical protein
VSKRILEKGVEFGGSRSQSVAHVVGSGEDKAQEGALLKRGQGLPAEGGPNEKLLNQERKETTDERNEHHH